MKILVVGDSGHTGFGTVTKALAERFLAAGHDVRIIARNHRGEPVRGALAGRVWPTSIGPSLGGSLVSNAIGGGLWPRLESGDKWKPDQVLVISDMSGLLEYFETHPVPKADPKLRAAMLARRGRRSNRKPPVRPKR